MSYTPPPRPPRGDEQNVSERVHRAIDAWAYYDDVPWWYVRSVAETIDSLIQQGILSEIVPSDPPAAP